MTAEISENFLDPEKTKYISYQEMSKERLEELARLGDIKAIEELLNREFKAVNE